MQDLPDHDRRGTSSFELGRLTQSIEVMNTNMIEMKGEIRELREDVATIKNERAREKGIYRGMVIIATAIGSGLTIIYQLAIQALKRT